MRDFLDPTTHICGISNKDIPLQKIVNKPVLLFAFTIHIGLLYGAIKDRFVSRKDTPISGIHKAVKTETYDTH